MTMTTQDVPCPCLTDDGALCGEAIEVAVEIDGEDAPEYYDANFGWQPREYASLIPRAPLVCPDGHALTIEQRAALCVEAVRLLTDDGPVLSHAAFQSLCASSPSLPGASS